MINVFMLILMLWSTPVAAQDCKDKTGSNGKSDCPNVKYLCTRSMYKELMKEQCPLTCGYCTAPNTNNNNNNNQQNDPTNVSGDCKDKTASNGKSDCPKLQYLCKNNVYKDLMKEQCPLTCNYCKSNSNNAANSPVAPDYPKIAQPCADKQATCPNFKYLCKQKEYKAFMYLNCSNSCGYCA